ncbi:RING finger protein 223-like [Empidonax traillii]|uniref:RING finger protein 223-like n=1 Tax=Empidonax traillii TaxID=164674 RepID=UPI000FFCF854|nr:RING finger protein 223-like [Empidonax traillii]
MESSALLPAQVSGSTTREAPRALFLSRGSVMSCFSQLWHSSTPDSPTSPTPASPGEIPIPISPIVRLSRCEVCDDWKRILLLSALIIILFCIILWPVQCALKTGNLRCFTRTVAMSRPEYLPPKPTEAAAAVTQPPFQ